MPSTRRQTRVKQNNAAPVHSLPNEIIAECFRIGFEEFDCDGHSFVRYLSTISAVCNIWRRAALGLPSLWTNIAYCATHHELKSGLERIDAYLTRSKSLPLYVSLDFYEGRAQSLRMAKLLSQHSRRFSFLRITINTVSAARIILPLTWPLDSLSELQFQITLDIEQTALPSDLEMELFAQGSSAPLRKIKVLSFLPCKFSHVPSSLLVDINVCSLDVERAQIMTLLSNCPLAEGIEVYFHDPDSNDNHSVPSFELPSLERLLIPDSLLPTFPSQFNAAGLSHLTLLSTPISSATVADVPQFASLSYLKLKGFHVHATVLNTLLSATPTLTRLSVTDCCPVSSVVFVLNGMTRDEEIALGRKIKESGTRFEDSIQEALDPVAPNLERVEFLRCHNANGDASFGGLVSVLLMRRRALRVFTDDETWEGSSIDSESVAEQDGGERLEVVL